MTGMTSEVEEDAETEEGGSTDILEIVTYVLRAARRHWLLGLLLALPVVTAGILAAIYLPPKYEAMTGVFVAQEGSAVRGSNPDPVVSETDPMKGFTERVMQGDNLREIVRVTKLDQLWEKRRPPLLRLKDELTTPLRALPPDIRVRVLARTLEQRLTVWTEDRTMFFKVTWSDPETAALLANVARTRYLEGLLQQELAVIKAAMEILEKETAQAADTIDSQLKVLETAYREANQPKTSGSSDEEESSTVVFRRPSSSGKSGSDASLAAKLETIRTKIRQTREPWQQHLAEAKARLTDMLTVLGPEHPQVKQQQRRIEAASKPPPALSQLRQQEKQLLSEIKSMSTASASDKLVPVRVKVSQQNSGATTESAPQIHETAAISTEQSKLVSAIDRYNGLTSRLESARLQLNTAETAFRYRFVVLDEAEPPESRSKPKLPLMIALGSIAFALILGLSAGAARELATGKVLEVWQVKQLGLPLLAELDSHGRQLP